MSDNQDNQFNAGIAWARQKGLEWREQNDSLFRRFKDLRQDGVGWDEAIDRVCEVYHVGPRRVRNVIARRTGTNSLDAQALTGEFIVREVWRLVSDINNARDWVDEQIDKIDEQGDEFVTVERRTDWINEKEINKDKKYPKAIAKKQLLEDLMTYQEKVFSAIGKLMPQSIINNTLTQMTSNMTDAQADTLLDEAVKRNRLDKTKLDISGGDNRIA